MTYLELYKEAERKLEKNEITMGKFIEIIAPLRTEIPERKKGTKYYRVDDVIKVLLDNDFGDEENGADPEYMTALHDVYRGLENISVFTIPEREKGKWIKKGFSSEFHSEIYQCSKCNYELFSLGAPLNFCPNCGTDMGDINDGY